MTIIRIIHNINTRRKVLLSLLAAILFVRFIPHAGECYALYIYPYLSKTISFLSSFVHFSLTEWIVIITIIVMIVYPFRSRQQTKRHRLFIEIEILLWFTVWFYLGWGLNYYRDSFFQRITATPSQPSLALNITSHHSHSSSPSESSLAHPTKAQFLHFLTSYTDSLNATYCPIDSINPESVISEIKSIYKTIPSNYGLTQPTDYQQPKHVVFNFLYSSVAVLGYMGPFADESHLNAQLFPIQYPYTYAHELAHLLSVSSEAEANFWAYSVCTHSTNLQIRYSGYFGLLPNVFRNAKSILSPTEFKSWRATINPRIINQRIRLQDFWHSQYNPLLADIQDVLFNALLKSNNISDGTANYDKVILMILAQQSYSSQ